jgi:hypothetical protein
MMEYKGLYIPIEKKTKEKTFEYEKNEINKFEELRELIYQDFHNR